MLCAFVVVASRLSRLLRECDEAALARRDYSSSRELVLAPVDKETFKSTHPAGIYAGHAMVGEGDVCSFANAIEIVMGSHPAGRMQGVLTVPPSRAECWACLHRGRYSPTQQGEVLGVLGTIWW